MFKNSSSRNYTSGNVRTQPCDGAILIISGDAILDGINFLNSALNFGNVGWEIDGTIFLDGIELNKFIKIFWVEGNVNLNI